MTINTAIGGWHGASRAGAAMRGAPKPIMSAALRRPLVIGLGNVHLCDDGAGVQLAKQLPAQLGADAAVFIDGGLMSLSLLPYIEATHSVVVIHSADTQDPPGAMELYEGDRMDAFLGRPRAKSVHERGLIDLLEFARQRTCLPARRALLCIQPKRTDWGEALSLPVFRALPEAARLVGSLLERWKHD
jgi:hydrogenase maturation protease